MKKLITLTLLLLVAACQTKAPNKIQDDKMLFEQGMHYFSKRSYISAIDYFVEIKNRFPESQFVKDARLRLADSYYHSSEFIDAEIEYHQFTNLYPLHKDIPYAWFQMGMAQYEQAPRSHEKDLNLVRASKATFTMVKRKWPASDYADKARDMIDKCNDKEIEKQLYLARFYYRTKKFPVVIKKLEALSLQNNDNIEYIGKRNLLLAKAYIKVKEKDRAAAVLSAILKDPKLADYHGESYKYLQKTK